MELATSSPKMLAAIEDGIGWMIYNNPERHNAMSLEMQAAIPAIVEHFQRNEAVRVMVIRGAGDKAFISGADISEFESRRSSPESIEAYRAITSKASAAIAAFDKPIVAMIQGYCIGGGLALSLAADIRIAADDSQFGIPAARLGLGYDFRGVRELVNLVGPAYANEIFFTARKFSAEDALRMGLINRVVAKAGLEPATRELASSIAQNAPLTIKAARFSIRQALRDPDRREMQKAQELIDACMTSEDYVEGRRAFMEKRKAAFKGR